MIAGVPVGVGVGVGCGGGKRGCRGVGVPTAAVGKIWRVGDSLGASVVPLLPQADTRVAIRGKTRRRVSQQVPRRVLKAAAIGPPAPPRPSRARARSPATANVEREI